MHYVCHSTITWINLFHESFSLYHSTTENQKELCFGASVLRTQTHPSDLTKFPFHFHFSFLKKFTHFLQISYLILKHKRKYSNLSWWYNTLEKEEENIIWVESLNYTTKLNSWVSKEILISDMCWLVFVGLTQARITWEDGSSSEKRPP